jgi:hypothetical protein
MESDAECEEYLRTYQSIMFPFFPAVVIPQSMSVKDLRRQRPFLWLVIRSICNNSSIRQKALRVEIRETLGKNILLEANKSLDLLLGIVVFVGWGHHFLWQGPMHLTNAILLGQSLASELGLIRAFPKGPFGSMLNYNVQGNQPSANSFSDLPSTMEERRAVIGLVYVTSV